MCAGNTSAETRFTRNPSFPVDAPPLPLVSHRKRRCCFASRPRKATRGASQSPLGRLGKKRWDSASPQRDFGVQSHRPPIVVFLIMESAYEWLVWIALAFGVAAIIAQWIRLLRKPTTCLRCGGRLKKIDGTSVCERCV